MVSETLSIKSAWASVALRLGVTLSLVLSPYPIFADDNWTLTPLSPRALQDFREKQILRAIESSRVKKNAFYVVFQEDDPPCNGAEVEMLLAFGKNGVGLRFFDDRPKAEILVEADRREQIGLVENGACLVKFTIAKEIRINGDWMRVRSAGPPEVMSFDEAQSEAFSKPSKGPGQSLQFLFAAKNEETCPRGGGLGEWWRASMLFILGGGKSLGQVESRKSSVYERRFDVTRDDCKYEITVTISVKTGDAFSPLRARNLGSGEFE